MNSSTEENLIREMKRCATTCLFRANKFERLDSKYIGMKNGRNEQTRGNFLYAGVYNGGLEQSNAGDEVKVKGCAEKLQTM